MKEYTALFLDLDNTLLDFQAAEEYSFYHTCTQHGIPADAALLAEYQRINDGYWKLLEQGVITKPELLSRRFSDLFTQQTITGIDPDDFNREYLDNLSLHTVMLPGALEVCQALSSRYPLYLASNGVARAQTRRLAATPLGQYFKGVIVSETAGAEKPDPRFFQYAFAAYGLTDPASLLMIGDSLTADIAGGTAAGMDTCWYNPTGKAPGTAAPTYVVRRLEELPVLLGCTL